MESADRTISQDERDVRRHIESLFAAFLEGDRTTLREGRIAEWMGFQIRSRQLVNGVDEYMAELEAALESLHVERYEFLDFHVEVLGDTALAFYVARDWLEPGPDRPATVLIRALDVYRRVDGVWLQAASNINLIVDDQG